MLRGGHGPWAEQVRVVAAGVVLVLCASACSAAPTDDPAGPAEATPTNVVGEDGLELAVGDAVLTFPAGSATGAEVSAEEVAASAAPARVPFAPPTDAEPSAAAASVADGVAVVPLSEGVTVSLDDGDVQPSAPVQVSFTIPADVLEGEVVDEDTGEGSGLGVRAGNVALAVLSDDGTVELVPAVFDETTGTVTGDVEHFSSVWPIAIDFTWVIDTVLQGIGVTSPQPACDGEEAQVGDTTYSTVSQPQMWVCVGAAGEGLKVSVTPNAPSPFVATPSVKATRFQPGAEISTASLLATAVANGSGVLPEGSVAVFPGGTTDLFYDDPAGSFSVDFDTAPALYLVQILSEVAGVLFGISGTDLARKMANLECVAQIIPAGLGFGNEGLDPADVTGISKSFFACAGPMMEQLGGEWPPQVEVLFAIVTTAPQLLVGAMLGILTTATGLASSTAPIDAVVGEDVLDPSEVAGFVGTWHGPVDQPGSRDYSMEVTLRTATSGKLRGSVSYPGLACVGYWASPRLDGSTLSMVEHITPGDHTCLLEVDIDVTLSEDGTELSYSADDGLATATLTRGKAAPPDAAKVGEFLGTWHGAVDQPSSSRDYSVEVTLSTTADGELRGSVRYPELGCSGSWDSPRLDGSTLSVVENIKSGVGSCVLKVNIDVTLSEDGTELAYSSPRSTATLTRTTDTGADAGTWPTGKDEAPGALYTWFGANGYNLPDWVACDDARDWCAAGQGEGRDVMVIDLSGNSITDIGSIPLASSDPAAALTSAGVPAAAAQQLLS